MNNKPASHKNGTIQFKLVLLISAVLVAFAVVLSVASARFIRVSTTEALEQSMRQTAKISAGSVGEYMNLKVSLVRSIANRVGALYEDCIVPEYAAADIPYLETRLRGMADAYGFDLIFAVDRQGYARTAARGNIAALAPDYYTAIAADGKADYMSGVERDAGTLGGSVVNISAPIVNAAGEKIGVLVCKLDALFISDLVSKINLGESGSSFVMDGEGVCIAHKNPDMCFGGTQFMAIQNDAEYRSLNELWDRMRSEQEGFATYEYDGPRLAAFATVEGTNDWTIAITADEDEFLTQADSSVVIMILLTVFFLIVAFIVCLLYIRPITRRIAAVTERLERLSKGDLSHDVERVDQGDEVGRLHGATSALVYDLSDMIDAVGTALSDMAQGRLGTQIAGTFIGDFSRLKTAVEQNLARLNALVKQILTASEEVSRGSAQIAEGATALAQGASEQAASIENLYGTVSELNGRTKEISDPGKTRLPEVDDAPSEQAEAERLEKMPTLVDKLSGAMEIIRQRLSEVSGMSSAIDTIAAETSMLALNASVEATHAGEYGRGFAVIAAQVRELSEKCRNESQSAKQLIDRSLRAVARGDQVVSGTIEAVGFMTRSLTQVEAMLSQISQVIEDTAATAEESAASSQELSAQSEMLRDLVSAFTCDPRE